MPDVKSYALDKYCLAIIISSVYLLAYLIFKKYYQCVPIFKFVASITILEIILACCYIVFNILLTATVARNNFIVKVNNLKRKLTICNNISVFFTFFHSVKRHLFSVKCQWIPNVILYFILRSCTKCTLYLYFLYNIDFSSWITHV